ncbi:MAG: phosphoglycerate kinase [Phycisphaerae bacterium]
MIEAPKKSVRDLAVKGLRVLIRADLNVPLDSRQNITDDTRIRKFLPTLEHVVAGGGRAILMSHLGRPKGDPQADKRLSLRPVANRISELTKRPCKFVEHCIGPEALAASSGLEDGEVLLLENLRFDQAETVIDKAKENLSGKLTPAQEEMREAFARSLAAHADVYVNDAFGTCHRKHVSMYDVPQLVAPGGRVTGFLVEKELRYLGQALESPKRPFVAVLGGAKVSDKIGVIKNLLQRVDHILIGGAMTYTFWAAQDRSIGKSLCEHDQLDLAKELLAAAGDKLHLPVDSVAATELKEGVKATIVDGELPPELMGLDIGPRTLGDFTERLREAGTIVWNGPVGAFEIEPFNAGTFALARTIAEATDRGAVTVIGGGDTAAAVEQANLADRMTHVSTGGGASLKFLEGKRFEPLEVIDEV